MRCLFNIQHSDLRSSDSVYGNVCVRPTTDDDDREKRGMFGSEANGNGWMVSGRGKFSPPDVVLMSLKLEPPPSSYIMYLSFGAPC